MSPVIYFKKTEAQLLLNDHTMNELKSKSSKMMQFNKPHITTIIRL